MYSFALTLCELNKIPRERRCTQFHHLCEFDRGQTIGSQEAEMSFLEIAQRLDHDHGAATVMGTYRVWFEEGRQKLTIATNHVEPTRDSQDRRSR